MPEVLRRQCRGASAAAPAPTAASATAPISTTSSIRSVAGCGVTETFGSAVETGVAKIAAAMGDLIHGAILVRSAHALAVGGISKAVGNVQPRIESK